MYDTLTFLTHLYALCEQFCATQPLPQTHAGRKPTLSLSQTLALCLLCQWREFASERGFYRWAARHLHGTFCTLPAYSQFNRAVRRIQPDLAAFLVYTAQTAREQAAYEILDSYGVATRRVGRRGDGWLPLSACRGKCTRLGWYEGCKVFDAVTPDGMITGLGLAPANVQEQPCTETFLWARQHQPASLGSAGKPCASGIYLADRGFNGVERHLHWGGEYAVNVLCPPRKCDPGVWKPIWHGRHKQLRQLIESVHDKLLHTFRLDRERPHHLRGLYARLCAKAALHNVCIRFNQQAGRAPMQFADLIAW